MSDLGFAPPKHGSCRPMTERRFRTAMGPTVMKGKDADHIVSAARIRGVRTTKGANIAANFHPINSPINRSPTWKGPVKECWYKTAGLGSRYRTAVQKVAVASRVYNSALPAVSYATPPHKVIENACHC